ncbi:OFA family oxalate/formate antiporter-like MFS transporter [Pseudoduganella flava]|uniref:OFA family oxalate/formate antiporter-like MFS transporter n=1 Tax=Pseudoduganella flava TaxID=871742 RepID=A0A562PMV3_9BURK|nr:oxalate/formate MFS antiporter [Pseudoduganella flava]QGZ40934.1 oxalate/formate MFS antiporter [Pseudoduganella flava]TWI45386.1 OFA family oxalate/formate antiporter-like MFS transporter [Pseudoduganella flava]
MKTEASTAFERPASFRWMQLVMGIICMAMIANLQYGWTLFVNPLSEAHGWSKASIQVAFTIFILTETWLVPVEGWAVDKWGPRPVVLFGGLLCAIGWVMNSFASSLFVLYVAAAISGIGAGAVYGTCVGSALKWFPDRRGLAAGLTAAGFGAGSAATIIPISNMIESRGYADTFLYFGLGQGAIVILLALMMARPPHAASKSAKKKASPAVLQTTADYKPSQMVRTPVFWVMYLMFVLVAAGGLMATAQMGPIAKDFEIDGIKFNVMGMVLPALTFALAIDRVLNGLTRPFFGWVSDQIGREKTMFIAFALESVGIIALYYFGRDPIMFVILTGLVFFAWGEIYSLFPATTADTFGTRNAAGNAGLMYTAKGTASIFVPISSLITAASGSWEAVFFVGCGMNALAAVLAWWVLRPMRKRFIEEASGTVTVQDDDTVLTASTGAARLVN